MSDTDPAEAPRGRDRDRGAWPDPPAPQAGGSRPSHGGSHRDLPSPGDAPSGSKGPRPWSGQDDESSPPSVGGWPSVSEWRERKRRTADSSVPLVPPSPMSTAAMGETVHAAPEAVATPHAVAASGPGSPEGGEAWAPEVPPGEATPAGAEDSGELEDGGRLPGAGGDPGAGAPEAGQGSSSEAGDAAWWSPTPLLPSGEESEQESSAKSRRARRPGGRGGRKRGRAADKDAGWLPDGPDDGSTAAAAPDADPEAVARAICLRLLTMAPKTRAQLAQALRKRDVPEEAAEAVLDRFSELGLINDEAFAEAWVDSRHHGRGLAKRALAAELRHRGVDSDTVNEAVERLDPDQELETARRLVERKLAATRALDTQTRTRRLAGMLARKGYAPGLAFRVVKEALEQEGLEIDDDYP
ncbi:recombination regulator RecX [Nonomuraea sp. NPDC047897]|uniref:recombination regulator RecX n=1 Tax=Nonomuraea sp. NPDC047897 TaxID=3364346 RepID=UPI00371BCE0F